MTRVRLARRIGLAVTVMSLALAFALVGIWPGVGVVAAAGAAAWIAIERRRSTLVSGWWLAGTALLSVLAAELGRSAWLPLVAQMAALAVWDLDRFEQRVSGAEETVNEDLSQRHLSRLSLALVLGGSLAGLSLVIRAPLGFWPTLALAATLIVLLIGMLRRAST